MNQFDLLTLSLFSLVSPEKYPIHWRDQVWCLDWPDSGEHLLNLWMASYEPQRRLLVWSAWHSYTRAEISWPVDVCPTGGIRSEDLSQTFLDNEKDLTYQCQTQETPASPKWGFCRSPPQSEWGQRGPRSSPQSPAPPPTYSYRPWWQSVKDWE